MPKEVDPRSGEYTAIDAHMYALNVLLNPQVFFDGEKGMEELPELERQALINTIKQSIQEVIEED